MGKFEDYGILAEKYFVEDQLPVSAIAKKLHLTDKTLHEWKKNGNWEDKRKDYLTSQCSCNKALYELLHLVSQKAIDNYKTDGTMPDQKTLYFIMGMTDKLPKLKMYEKQEIQEKVEELNAVNKEKELKINTDDMLEKFFKTITG